MDKIKVFGIDAVDDALEAIKKGEMVATVKQQPALQMAMAVEAANDIMKGKEVEKLIIVPLQLITIETLQ
jgi:ribose transport system substrate-binding protein